MWPDICWCVSILVSGARDMAQATFPEDLGGTPSIHIYNFSFRGAHALFRPPWPPGIHVMHKHTCRQNTIHIKEKCKNNINFKYEGFDNCRCRRLFELEIHTCANCVAIIPCGEDGEPSVPVSPWLAKTETNSSQTLDWNKKVKTPVFSS